MNRATVTFGLLFVAWSGLVACDPVNQGLKQTASSRMDVAASAIEQFLGNAISNEQNPAQAYRRDRMKYGLDVLKQLRKNKSFIDSTLLIAYFYEPYQISFQLVGLDHSQVSAMTIQFGSEVMECELSQATKSALQSWQLDSALANGAIEFLPPGNSVPSEPGITVCTVSPEVLAQVVRSIENGTCSISISGRKESCRVLSASSLRAAPVK